MQENIVMQEHLHDKAEEKEKMMKEIEQLKNELKATNERNENMRKFNESSENIDEQLKSTKVTTGLGYFSIGPQEIGESSNPKKMKDDKRDKSGIKGMKFSKYFCNYCGKPGHKFDIYKYRLISHKKSFTFDGYCYNYHKYRHTYYECKYRSSSMSSRRSFMDIALHAINMDTKMKNACSRQMHQDIHPNWLALIEGVIISMSLVPLVEILVMLQRIAG